MSGKKKTDIVDELPVEVSQLILRRLDQFIIFERRPSLLEMVGHLQGRSSSLRRWLLRTLRRKRSFIPNYVFLFLQYALLGNLYLLSFIINIFLNLVIQTCTRHLVLEHKDALYWRVKFSRRPRLVFPF